MMIPTSIVLTFNPTTLRRNDDDRKKRKNI